MKKDLENYTPQNPEYVVDEEVRGLFPFELDFSVAGLKDKKECMKYIGKNFTAVFPSNEFAERKMDSFERTNIREEYCEMVENIIPKRKRELEEALEEAKRMKKEAEERYTAALGEVFAFAAEVKTGVTEVPLKPSDTFCMALAGYYLTYTWNEHSKTFILAKAVEIPEESDLWSNDENNRQMMLELWGCEFPERKEDF